MKMNGKKVGVVLAMFAAMLLTVGTVYAKPAEKPATADPAGELPLFVPATPGTDIGVTRTKCINGFAIVYFNKDREAYPTQKVCTEATGGTATNSRRVNPTNNGQGGKKCPAGTTEYQSCTPVQPLPCCYTNAN